LPPPIVGTGLEHKAAVDSRMLMNAEGHGVVEYVDADEIVINYEMSDEDDLVSFEGSRRVYKLTKFKKTNQYKIQRGHRQNYTAVQVGEIKL
jgi:DNA-directed RNA polymerase subunit beta